MRTRCSSPKASGEIRVQLYLSAPDQLSRAGKRDHLDATIEEHLEAKRHLVARATRAEEAVSSYSKARRRYTILDFCWSRLKTPRRD